MAWNIDCSDPLSPRLGAEDFTQGIRARADAVAAVAANNVFSVDLEARFPAEAIDTMRAQGLLAIMVPQDLGGEGASLSDVVDVCYRLAVACSSTAMIYAMHQIMVACLVRHSRNNPWHARFLSRICAEQLLLASSTTEGRHGGDIRASDAPVTYVGSRINLEKQATVISYGANADAIVTTARRAPDAPDSDQVLVAFPRETYSLEPLLEWDTLGMRGTCSAGFILRASGERDQILRDPYEKIHAQTMAPMAHLTWASVWTGIAADALQRAQAFMRHAARRTSGQVPPGAVHLTRARSSLETLRWLVTSFLRRYERALHSDDALVSLDFQTMTNLIKVEASELAVSIVLSAFRACGLSGYRNDTEFTLGRHIRDILSSPIMINNERILSNLGPAALMSTVPKWLCS